MTSQTGIAIGASEALFVPWRVPVSHSPGIDYFCTLYTSSCELVFIALCAEDLIVLIDKGTNNGSLVEARWKAISTYFRDETLGSNRFGANDTTET